MKILRSRGSVTGTSRSRRPLFDYWWVEGLIIPTGGFALWFMILFAVWVAVPSPHMIWLGYVVTSLLTPVIMLCVTLGSLSRMAKHADAPMALRRWTFAPQRSPLIVCAASFSLGLLAWLFLLFAGLALFPGLTGNGLTPFVKFDVVASGVLGMGPSMWLLVRWIRYLRRGMGRRGPPDDDDPGGVPAGARNRPPGPFVRTDARPIPRDKDVA